MNAAPTTRPLPNRILGKQTPVKILETKKLNTKQTQEQGGKLHASHLLFRIAWFLKLPETYLVSSML